MDRDQAREEEDAASENGYTSHDEQTSRAERAAPPCFGGLGFRVSGLPPRRVFHLDETVEHVLPRLGHGVQVQDLQQGSGRYCSPCHRHALEPSFLELIGMRML
jgi:hypothetical protein